MDLYGLVALCAERLVPPNDEREWNGGGGSEDHSCGRLD